MPFDKEKDKIRGMVLAENYGWAILALMELVEVTELHCLEQTEQRLASIKEAVAQIQEAADCHAETLRDMLDAVQRTQKYIGTSRQDPNG